MKNLALILAAILVSGIAYAQSEDDAKTQELSQAEERLIRSQQNYIKCIEKFKSDLKAGGSPFYELNVISRTIPSAEYPKDINIQTKYITYSTPNRIFDVTEHGTMQYSPEEGSTSCTSNVCNCPLKTEPETIRVLFGKRLKVLQSEFLESYDKENTKYNKNIASILNSKDCSTLPEVADLKKELTQEGRCPACTKGSTTNGK